MLFVIFVFVTHFFKFLPGSLGYNHIHSAISAINRTLIEIWIVNDFTSHGIVQTDDHLWIYKKNT